MANILIPFHWERAGSDIEYLRSNEGCSVANVEKVYRKGWRACVYDTIMAHGEYYPTKKEARQAIYNILKART